MQVFQILVAILILAALSALLVFCKRKVMPKCCPCFQKIVTMIKNKLMFNSFFRAVL